MERPKYRDVWVKRLERDGDKPNPQLDRILELLDPQLCTDCVKCGSAKQNGQFVCSACSGICPDPDHRENWVAAADPPMCPHCAGWLTRLDMPCLFHPSVDCDNPPCVDARETGSRTVCHGNPKIRSGFFVYQLDTGYIGMTCNPSQRQAEHDARIKVERYISLRESSDDPIRYPSAYITHVIDVEIDEKFPDAYAKHWADVRKSDKRYQGERKIKWLSPVLESRQTAWRCEWALKDYARGASPAGLSRFEEITRVSSLPLLRLQAAGLVYDPDGHVLLFGLKWSLSGDLGPSQIVPVQFYEIERRDSILEQWVEVESNFYPTRFVEGKDKAGIESYHHPVSTLSGWAYRVRAVNDAGIPGPWAELTMSDKEMSAAMLQFLRVHYLSTKVRENTGIVDVNWSVANQPPGIRFFVERKDQDSGDSVLMESDVCSFADLPVPDGIKQYAYSVQADWKGYCSDWSIPSSVRVGSAVPGQVKDLRYIYQDLERCRLSWSAPDWTGYSAIRFYEVERYSGGWRKVGEISGEFNGRPSFLDKLLSKGFGHRVRAVNRHGAGPWSKEIAAGVRVNRAQVFAPGQVVEGKVESIKDYGAFVALGKGFSGLLHRSELTWSGNPKVVDVVKIGDKLTLKVISVDFTDPFKGKVGLSLREIQPGPWDSFSEQYKVGDLVNGTVEGLVDFGAFIQLSPEIKGLLHKSELGRNRVRHPSEVLQEGQPIKVKIIKIDLGRRRVSLSLRDL